MHHKMEVSTTMLQLFFTKYPDVTSAKKHAAKFNIHIHSVQQNGSPVFLYIAEKVTKRSCKMPGEGLLVA